MTIASDTHPNLLIYPLLEVFPTLVQDIIGMADEWGNNGESGRIDPFVEIYDVSVFPRVRIFWIQR